MRVKDWIATLFVWGRQAGAEGKVDLNYGEWEDVATKVDPKDAERLMTVVRNLSNALWWFYDNADAATQDKFWEKIQYTHPVNGPVFQIVDE